MQTLEHLQAAATERARAHFTLRLNRVRNAVQAAIISGGSGSHVLGILRDLHAQPLEDLGPAIWTISRDLLTAASLEHSPDIERELVAFVTKIVPPLRQETEAHCRQVLAYLQRYETQAGRFSATFANEAQHTMRMISGSLNHIEQTIQRDLQVQAIQFAHTLLREQPEPWPGRVFVVHGHDRAARDAVANLLYDLGLEPVILQEQPGTLQTIVEKLEQNSDVAFAIVLLTPDDEGRPRANGSEPQPRARQNVLLELGYFIGKLGRNRICALHHESVELPSDLSGIHYIPFDVNETWKSRVKRELLAADIRIDPSRLF